MGSDEREHDAPEPGRRRVLRALGLGGTVVAAAALGACATPPAPPPPRPPRSWSGQTPAGRLLIIGGAEDRVDEREILRRFMDLAGGPSARLRFITGATNEPAFAERAYGEAMDGVGARDIGFIHLGDAAEASEPKVKAEIDRADGLYITGGDQRRLMNKLWQTPAMQALHAGYRERGMTLAGTSAGAAAMSRAMIAQGTAIVVPQKDVISLDLGLNLLPQALVDQHFSQRRRLSRLLSAVALRPDLIGIGVDEDTALLVDGGRAIEVIGRSSVTFVDGVGMETNLGQAQPQDRLEMVGVQLHVLPAGRRYRHPDPDTARDSGEAQAPPAALRSVVARLLEPPPILVL